VEQLITIMEQLVQQFVNHQQVDWLKWLPIARVAMYDGASETTKCIPFFSIHGVDPRMSFAGEPMMEQDNPTINAYHVQATMQQLHDHLGVEMRRSRALQVEGSNRRRIPAPNNEERSLDLLDAGYIRTTDPTQTVDWKRLGPITVVW